MKSMLVKTVEMRGYKRKGTVKAEPPYSLVLKQKGEANCRVCYFWGDTTRRPLDKEGLLLCCVSNENYHWVLEKTKRRRT